MPNITAVDFVKKFYGEKHPILLHLRIHQGFHYDDVIEIMEKFSQQREEEIKEEYYFKGLEQGRAEGYASKSSL
jgi:hypothetical protein